MKELERSYNTLFFDGNECSQIVVYWKGQYLRIQASEFYLNEKPRFSGQDYTLELSDIKRGNKTLFKDCESMPLLKDNRIVPRDSIAYEIREKEGYYYGNGDWLFIHADNVTVENVSDDVGQYYTTRTRKYSIDFQGHTFATEKRVTNANIKQARERVFDNLVKELSSYNFSDHKSYLEAQLHLLEKCHDGSIRLNYSDIEEVNQFGDKKQYLIINIVGEDEFCRFSFNPCREIELENLLNKYDENKIQHFYKGEFNAIKN